MKLGRLTATSSANVCVDLIANGRSEADLTDAGVRRMTDLIERRDVVDEVTRLGESGLAEHRVDDIRQVTPVGSQDVWAAGVTHLRSRDARMAESEFGASAYDRVYDAARPEIFFKALPEKVVLPRRGGRHPGRPAGTCRNRSWRCGQLLGNDVGTRSATI
jgi:2-dehydro-3-deoxy-D-arabinonate dehydratase